VIGRIDDGWVKLDLRGLEDDEAFLAALGSLPRADVP
jgi:hypothetical protein